MLLGRVREERAAVLETIRMRDEPNWSGWGPPAGAGVFVDEKAAYGVSAYYACIRAQAEPFGSMPAKVYEKLPNGDRREAEDHPLYELVHDRPNPCMSAASFHERMVEVGAGYGDGLAFIEHDKSMRVRALWPLRRDRATIERKDGRLRYYVLTDKGVGEWFEDWEILHIPGFGFDGIRGYRPVDKMREALGLAIATEQFGASFFANGLHASGGLKHPKNLTKPAQDRLVAQMEERHIGSGKTMRPLVLEEGLEWVPMSVAPNDAQFLETRNYSDVVIARFMRVPASEIDAMGQDSLTYKTLEQDARRYYRMTVLPWDRRVRCEYNYKLFSAAQRGRFYVEFVFEALLRGDAASQAEAYRKGTGGAAWLTPNDVRKDLNMPPVEGGDELPKSKAATGPDPLKDPLDEPDDKPPADADPKRTLAILAPLAADAADRCVRREAKAMRAALPRIEREGAKGLEAWGGAFYRGHEDYIARSIEPVLSALFAASLAGAEGGAPEVARRVARKYCDDAKSRAARALAKGALAEPDAVVARSLYETLMVEADVAATEEAA